MRIALIGAPTSGKSELAEELNEALGFDILDGYDKALLDCKIPIGEEASFREGLVMHAEQYRQEFLQRRAGHSFVSCGTGVERVAHALVRYHRMALSTSTEERRASDVDLVGAEMLSALMIDGMVYDVVAFLPLADPPPSSNAKVLPASNFEATVDAHIRQLLQDFEISAVWLEGTTEERLALLLPVLAEWGAPNDRSDDAGADASEVPN